MSSKSKIILSISVLAIVAIIIYVFSATCPWTGDDINYRFNWAAKPNLEEINSIRDIFISQWVHYFMTNGRFIAHCFVQLFCGLLGQQAFAISNAIIYIAYILLVLKLGGGNIKNTLAIISTSILTLITYDTFYGPACQMGFVWSFTLVFSWIYLFFKINTSSIFKLFIIFLFSIIAGNSQEAITIGISGALIIYAITNFKKLTPAQWAAFFGFGIGSLLICISPATISRADEQDIPLATSLFNLFSHFRVFYILIVLLIIKLINHSLNLKEFYSKNSFLINAILTLLIFNLAIGVFCNRQLFGIEAISTILILRLLRNAHFNRIALISLTIFTLVTFYIKWDIISHAKSTDDKIYELLSKSQDGSIYYNITNHNYMPEHLHFVQPVATIYHLPQYLTESINNLYQSETGDTTKVLTIYPECLQNINDSTHVENQVVKFDEGCFVVVQSKENPADFIVKRTLDLFIYKRPHSDYKFSWDNPQFEGPNYKANIIYQAVPFVTNDSIIIE